MATKLMVNNDMWASGGWCGRKQIWEGVGEAPGGRSWWGGGGGRGSAVLGWAWGGGVGVVGGCGGGGGGVWQGEVAGGLRDGRPDLGKGGVLC